MNDLKPVQFDIQTIIEWDEWKKQCIPNLRYAAKLKMPHLPQMEPHGGKCIIVGGGPTITDHLEKIRGFRAHPVWLMMSLNGAHEWLINRGIIPNIHVVFEMDLEDVRVALGGDPHQDVTYYVCSHCKPQIFQQLGACKKVLWHAFHPPQGYQQAIARHFKGEFMVSGGYATFFRSLVIACILGYRDFELFGMDSSFEESSHVGGYATADKEPRVTVWGKDYQTGDLRKFTTQGGLAFQATEFLKFCEANQAGLRLRVHGDGLLRYLHESRYPEQYQTRKDISHGFGI